MILWISYIEENILQFNYNIIPESFHDMQMYFFHNIDI